MRHRLQGEVRPGQARQRATNDHVQIAQPIDIHTHRIRRERMFSDGPRAQSPARAEQHEMEHEHQHNRRQRNWFLLENDRPDPRHFRQEPERNRRQHRQSGGCTGQEQLAVQITGQTHRQDVDHRARDDLIDAESDRQHRVEQRHRAATGDREQQRNRDVVGVHAGHESGERGREHHALDADIHHTRSLAADARQRAERDGRRLGYRDGQDRDGGRRAKLDPDEHQQDDRGGDPEANLHPPSHATVCAGIRQRCGRGAHVSALPQPEVNWGSAASDSASRGTRIR